MFTLFLHNGRTAKHLTAGTIDTLSGYCTDFYNQVSDRTTKHLTTGTIDTQICEKLCLCVFFGVDKNRLGFILTDPILCSFFL